MPFAFKLLQSKNVSLTFDTLYTVISNGVLKDKKKNTDGTATWHYAMSKPMVPYLIMIDRFLYFKKMRIFHSIF